MSWVSSVDAGSALLRDEALVGALYAFHGEVQGARIARKHLGWYAKDRPENAACRAVVNGVESAADQLRLTRRCFDQLAEQPRLAA